VLAVVALAEPEIRDQPNIAKNLVRIVKRANAILRFHAIAKPGPRKFPYPGKRDDLTVRFSGCTTPIVDFLLRPEQNHRRSGVNQIVVPDAKRQREVDDEAIIRAKFTALD